MVKRWFFFIIGFLVLSAAEGLILPSLVRAEEESAEAQRAKAGDFTLSGYTEIGKRSTAEDYEEEDTDDDYTYRNYHLKFGQKVSDRLSYDIGSFVYDKDYDAKDSLDNISRIFKKRI